jgi:hypothetical protein
MKPAKKSPSVYGNFLYFNLHTDAYVLYKLAHHFRIYISGDYGLIQIHSLATTRGNVASTYFTCSSGDSSKMLAAIVTFLFCEKTTFSPSAGDLSPSDDDQK